MKKISGGKRRTVFAGKVHSFPVSSCGCLMCPELCVCRREPFKLSFSGTSQHRSPVFSPPSSFLFFFLVRSQSPMVIKNGVPTHWGRKKWDEENIAETLLKDDKRAREEEMAKEKRCGESWANHLQSYIVWLLMGCHFPRDALHK